MGLLSRPFGAFAAGLAICAVILAFWLMDLRNDQLGLMSFLARCVHIFAAMLWVGMIWFVNFIQLAALRTEDEASRATVLRLVVPHVARIVRISSHIVVASGAGLLVTTGYVLDRWVFPSAVYIPTLRAGVLWGGALAALGMWALVHFVIWPNLKIVLDPDMAAEAKVGAREWVRFGARINLMLAGPVTFVMVAASHLY